MLKQRSQILAIQSPAGSESPASSLMTLPTTLFVPGLLDFFYFCKSIFAFSALGVACCSFCLEQPLLWLSCSSPRNSPSHLCGGMEEEGVVLGIGSLCLTDFLSSSLELNPHEGRVLLLCFRNLTQISPGTWHMADA